MAKNIFFLLQKYKEKFILGIENTFLGQVAQNGQFCILEKKSIWFVISFLNVFWSFCIYAQKMASLIVCG